LDQIAAAPPSAPSLWRSFETAKARGDVAAASRALERIRRLGSDDPAFWSDVGIAYAGLERWDDAATALQRAVDAGARDLPTLAHLAAIRLADERFAEAARLIGVLQAAHPDAAQTSLLLGHAEKARGDFAAAARARFGAAIDRFGPETGELAVTRIAETAAGTSIRSPRG